MKIELFYRLQLYDEKGKLVKDTGLKPSHSYVIQFLELVRAFFANGTTVSMTAIDGTEQICYRDNYYVVRFGRADAGVGVLWGPRVGTNAGATPEGNTDYSLDTEIGHSTIGTPGTLNHRDTTITAARVVGANIDLDISRAFANESGSTITVKEIALYVRNTQDSVTHMLLRDVVTDEAVPDGYTLNVIYTLRTTA